MNPEEVLLMYGITDPVYQGLIKWRMGMLAEWRNKYMQENLQRILEIGTGNFPFSIALGSDMQNVDFVGLERNDTMSERARLHLKGKFKSVEIRTQMWNDAALEKEFKGEQYDLVTSFEVFEHVPKSDHFVQNAHKVLKPGGYLIVETPNTNVTPLFQKVFNQDPNGAADYEGTEHVNELSFRDLFLDIREAGFEVIDLNCYYLPVTLWDDASLPKDVQTQLYEHIHKAAGMFPFYSYVQAFIARKK